MIEDVYISFTLNKCFRIEKEFLIDSCPYNLEISLLCPASNYMIAQGLCAGHLTNGCFNKLFTIPLDNCHFNPLF